MSEDTELFIPDEPEDNEYNDDYDHNYNGAYPYNDAE